MKTSPHLWIWSTVTVLVAVTSAWRVSHQSPRGASEASFHEWMHANLAMTPEQHEALTPYETAFEIERFHLRKEIRESQSALASAIEAPGAKPETVDAALQRLQSAQEELQRATLRHFFLMKQHLDPGQAEKMVRWTHDNLLDGSIR